MKKGFMISFSISLFVGLFLNNNFVYATTEELLNSQSNTTKGYWSESNAPEFYGTTKIVLKQGDLFSLKDARYRIFAEDFEDFDLTQSIEAEHNVNIEVPGDYEINYSVTDSHGNKTTLIVPVTVTNNPDEQPMIERTMYTLEDIDNVKAMGIERGHNHDRQMLGLFIEANSNIEIRKTAGNSNLTYTMLNNDKLTESSKTITNEWQTITFEHDYTPFIKTLYKHSDPVKYEVRWDSNDKGVKELNYYHEGDDEQAFFDKWRNDTDAYAVVESYILTVLVPYADRDLITGHYAKGFDHLDDFFNYWRKVVEAFDKTLALDYAPEHPYDQNVNARFFIKANAHGAGAAYYATDHIGVNKPSVASFFEVNWGGLHEVGHGYQGSLGKGDLNIGEVSNNIFGHYVQIDKSIYPYDGDWLGKLPNIEEKHNKVRLDGGTFHNLEVSGKLYFVINFLNAFEGPDTYAHIAKLFRHNIIEGKELLTQDAWILGIYDKYGVSLIDYFEEWGIKVSEDVRYTVESGDFENAFSMKDLVIDQDIVNQIKSDLGKDCNYAIVTNEQLAKYNLTGSSTINIQIDNLDLLKGKYISLKDGQKTIAKIKIENNTIKLPELPIGVYKLEVPELIGSHVNNAKSLIIYNNQNTEFNLIYEESNIENSFENDVKIQFQGYYYNDAAEIKLVNDNNNLKLNLRYRGTTLFNSNLPADYEYAKIQVLNNNDTVVYKKVVGGKNEHFSKVNVETFEVPVEIGYKVVIKYHNAKDKLKFISNLNGDYRTDYQIESNQEATFIVTEKGLRPFSMTDEQFYNEYTARMKQYMDNFIAKATEEEIYNKHFYKTEKGIIVRGYEQMNEADQLLYQDLYNKIVKGYLPVIDELEEITVRQGKAADLLSGVTATDKEDGDLTNEIIISLSDVSKLPIGQHELEYSVTDSDGNTVTATRIVNIVSNEAPVLVGVENKTIKVGEVETFDKMDGITATDDYDSDLKIIVSGEIEKPVAGSNQNYTLTYTVTDSDGNTTTVDRIITVTNQIPLISGLEEITVRQGKTVDLSLNVIATDEEDGDLTKEVTIPSTDILNLSIGTHQVEYSVTDSDGNKITETRIINIVSNRAPILVGVENKTIKVGDVEAFNSLDDVTVSDDHDESLEIQVSGKVEKPVAGTNQDYTLTYTVTDSDGNITTKTRIIKVTNQIPVINGLNELIVREGKTADLLLNVTATDEEDGDLTKEVTIPSTDVATLSIGKHEVSYSVTDSDKNTTTQKRIINVISNEAPALVGVENKTIKVGQVDTFNPLEGITVLDDHDDSLEIQVSGKVEKPVEGTNQDYILTYTVTDSDGNTTTIDCVITVTNQVPVISGLTEMTIREGKEVNFLLDVTAIDHEDGDLTDEITISSTDALKSVIGMHEVEYSVADSDGNTTTQTRIVYVVSNEAPVLVGVENKTIKVGEVDEFNPLEGVIVSDDHDSGLDIEVSGTVEKPVVGTNQDYTLTYTVTDSDGNTTTINRVITVTNQIPTVKANSVTIKMNKAIDLLSDPRIGLVASDHEDGDLTNQVEIKHLGGFNFEQPLEGDYLVTYMVIDSDGNEAEQTINIKVQSNNIPVFNGIDDLVIQSGETFNPLEGVEVFDLEDGQLFNIEVIGKIDTTQIGNQSITYQVIDSDNNIATWTRTIKVIYQTEKPTDNKVSQTIIPHTKLQLNQLIQEIKSYDPNAVIIEVKNEADYYLYKIRISSAQNNSSTVSEYLIELRVSKEIKEDIGLPGLSFDYSQEEIQPEGTTPEDKPEDIIPEYKPEEKPEVITPEDNSSNNSTGNEDTQLSKPETGYSTLTLSIVGVCIMIGGILFFKKKK